MNLKSMSDNLTRLFETEYREKRLGDASIYVNCKGQTYTGFFGNAKQDSIFRIYSMTKPITSVAAMMLLERGIIDLEDPISKFLPGLEASNMKTFVTENYDLSNAKNLERTRQGNLVAESRKEIRIRNLLNMTSGLPYPGVWSKVEKEVFDAQEKIEAFVQEKKSRGEKVSNIEIATMLAQTPLAFEPGEGWLYGTSADILGAVIEAATGIEFGTFIKQEILDPLNMKDTWFSIPEENLGRWIYPYTRKEDGHVEKVDEEMLRWLGQSHPEIEHDFQSGGAYLYSTLGDYAAFALMLLNGGTYNGRHFIGRKTLEFMTTDQLTDEQRKMSWLTEDGYGYANLMRIMIHPEKNGCGSVGEFGWDGMAGTYFLVDPKEDLVVVFMQQIKEGGDKALRRKFRNIIYGAI